MGRFIARPGRLLIYLAAGFLLLFGYNRYTGLHKDASWLDVGFEAVEEMGIGLLLAAGLLWLLGQIDGRRRPASWSARWWSRGDGGDRVSIAPRSSRRRDGKSGGPAEGGMEGDGGRPLGLAGRSPSPLWRVLFASNVAPTEEIVQIALRRRACGSSSSLCCRSRSSRSSSPTAISPAPARPPKAAWGR